MPQRIHRGLSAAFALTILAGLMIHATVTSGCSSSSAVATPESPADAANGAPSAAPAPAPPAEEQETFFPASKAGSLMPRKSQAPAKNQSASPNSK